MPLAPQPELGLQGGRMQMTGAGEVGGEEEQGVVEATAVLHVVVKEEGNAGVGPCEGCLGDE